MHRAFCLPILFTHSFPVSGVAKYKANGTLNIKFIAVF